MEKLTLEEQKTKDAGTIEILRAIVRPILIGFLGITSFWLIMNEMTGMWVDWWIGVFIFGGMEWVLERPIIKLASNIKIKGSQ